MKTPRRPQGGHLVMPPGRPIPRTPPPKTARTPTEAPDVPLPGEAAKAGGELAALAARIRDCSACGRAGPRRACGSGHPRATVMLLSAQPSDADLEASAALVEEAEPLIKAFEALGLPPSSLYGSTAVRCGSQVPEAAEIEACAPHLLLEIEAVEPQAIVAFGPQAAEAVRALSGQCGLQVPEDLSASDPVRIRADLYLLVTEPLPQGLVQKEAKKRLWRDLRLLRGVLEA